MVNLNQSINAYKNYVREERKFHGSMTPKEYGIQIIKRGRKNGKTKCYGRIKRKYQLLSILWQ